MFWNQVGQLVRPERLARRRGRSKRVRLRADSKPTGQAGVVRCFVGLSVLMAWILLATGGDKRHSRQSRGAESPQSIQHREIWMLRLVCGPAGSTAKYHATGQAAKRHEQVAGVGVQFQSAGDQAVMGQLSPEEMAKRAEEIEKLARSVKDEMAANRARNRLVADQGRAGRLAALTCGTGSCGDAMAVERMASMMWAASQVGWAARRRAATPAARGAAALVPMA